MSDLFLVAQSEAFHQAWPYSSRRLAERLASLGEVRSLQVESDEPLSRLADLSGVTGLVFLDGRLTDSCIQSAPELRMVACNTDNTGAGLPLDALDRRNIPIIDATAAWGPSVAETAIGLALCALRGIARWHGRMAAGEPLWVFPHDQFCDDSIMVNGELGTKRVGVIGLGQIGGKVAQFCKALGAQVMGCDPYLPRNRFKEWGVAPADMDSLARESEVLFVTVPPTPSARHLLDAKRIALLQTGAWVVVVTRAHAVEMQALRERILAGEIGGAFDVYDIEPLPPDDPLRGLPNVVHTPHIAGRTRDANLRLADMIAEEFCRITKGEPPQYRLTPEKIKIRTQANPMPPASAGS